MTKHDTDLPVFARRLKELRLAAKMTQKELAERSGMHLGGIFKLEQGVNRPSWDTVQILAAALGLDCSAFADPPLTPRMRKPDSRRGRPKKAADAPSPPLPAKRTRKRKE